MRVDWGLKKDCSHFNNFPVHHRYSINAHGKKMYTSLYVQELQLRNK